MQHITVLSTAIRSVIGAQTRTDPPHSYIDPHAIMLPTYTFPSPCIHWTGLTPGSSRKERLRNARDWSLTIVCSAEWGIASPGVLLCSGGPPGKTGGSWAAATGCVLSQGSNVCWPPAVLIFQHNAPPNLRNLDSEMFFIKKIHDEKHMSYYLLNALDTWWPFFKTLLPVL